MLSSLLPRPITHPCLFIHSRCYVSQPSIHPRGVKSTARTRLSTLDPSRLQPSDYLDLSGRKAPQTPFQIPPKSPSRGILHYARKGLEFLPYPQGTRGFLYYHQLPNAPFDGALRFRITETSDPAAFADGRDLACPNGFPWELSIRRIVKSPNFRITRDMLVAEGLVKPEVLEAMHQGLQNLDICPRSSKHVVSSFHQPFHLSTTLFSDASGRWLRMYALIQSLARYDDRRAFKGYLERPEVHAILPPDSILAAFEPLQLPGRAGERLVGLRLFKTHDTLGSTGKFMLGYQDLPEGELLMRGEAPWYRNVDNGSGVGKALALLYENQAFEKKLAASAPPEVITQENP